MSKTAKTEIVETSEAVEVEIVETEKMYNLDTDLFSEEYYAPLDESLPYAISDGRGYIIIPETEIEKSMWLDPPTDLVMESIKGGDKFSAYRMYNIRVSVLEKTPPFWYYSNSVENKASKVAGQPICWYNSAEGQALKDEMAKTTSPASSVRPYVYATKLKMMLLDQDSNPLHEIPLSCNFRGGACWHVLTELRQFYSSAEKVLAKKGNFSRTAFDKRVRALLIPDIKFGSEWIGAEGRKGESIRFAEITKPTAENLNKWYLGFKELVPLRNLIWNAQLDHQDCNASKLPAPIAALDSASIAPAIAAVSDAPQLSPGAVDPEAAELL